MCGIAGIVELNNIQSTVNLNLLKSMSDVIRHRGPDDDGQWISEDKKCGLTFRRLSIIDLSSAGHQPMSTPDGRFTIVFNGEIYNHLLIRTELEKKGYKYRSKTDTETILYGYAEFGPQVLNLLEGMWAFAIWDDLKKELFCSRDRIGKKPLYYTFINGTFVFGSEIKSILLNPKVKKELNFDELPNYLNFGMSSNNNTMFENIKKIPASHYLILKNNEIKIERYWAPIGSNFKYIDLTDNEVTDEIIRLLRLAIKDRMMSDVPFGVFLSGGIDSSLNVALMSELMDRPVDTFTVGFKELEKYNELEYARKIAHIYKTNHHEILIDENDAFPILQELTYHEDEPNADPVCIPLWFLSKLTRDSGTIVIQVGEGSDEQFVGYPWMLREYNFFKTYWKYFNSLPTSIKKTIYFALKPTLQGKSIQILEYFRRAAFGEQLYWSGTPIYSPSIQEKLLTENYYYLIEKPAKYAELLHNQLIDLYKDADFLQRILFIELYHRLSELLLMRVDKIGMAHSIEARVPFLDYRLVEFSMSLPTKIKTPDNKTTKYILKKAVDGILPKEIVYRKKQGFWAPVNEWLRHQWFDFAKHEILDSYFVKSGIFNANYLKYLLENHKAGKQNNGYKLFTLLELALWHNKFFS